MKNFIIWIEMGSIFFLLIPICVLAPLIGLVCIISSELLKWIEKMVDNMDSRMNKLMRILKQTQ